MKEYTQSKRNGCLSDIFVLAGFQLGLVGVLVAPLVVAWLLGRQWGGAVAILSMIVWTGMRRRMGMVGSKVAFWVLGICFLLLIAAFLFCQR